jgi:hypothetical protein
MRDPACGMSVGEAALRVSGHPNYGLDGDAPVKGDRELNRYAHRIIGEPDPADLTSFSGQSAGTAYLLVDPVFP